MSYFIGKIIFIILFNFVFYGLYSLWKYKPKTEQEEKKKEWDDF